ncbi:hypothetical protein DF3PB_690006 [uncultured Defluviicoccus sp.]|uniref:Uncharacterized protein n=1 Tax=metagenome TaxID=256318 RepID=A0A380TJ30_9ZZZZ|nr:hypothetical protein DF3PB_690006 [uncultured Defluviicoccus sp.]
MLQDQLLITRNSFCRHQYFHFLSRARVLDCTILMGSDCERSNEGKGDSENIVHLRRGDPSVKLGSAFCPIRAGWRFKRVSRSGEAIHASHDHSGSLCRRGGAAGE